MTVSKKNKEDYANKMFNKSYDNLSESEKQNVLHQYNIEHCVVTKEDQMRIMTMEEYYERRSISNRSPRIY
jgi:hypothetical protein